jgi:Family of unknown function (DUF5988)
MEETGRATSAASSVRAVLEGGPANIPTSSRVQTVGPHDEKIKLPHYGGYEHFERTGELTENVTHQEMVFRWTMRTEMAE